MKAGDHRQNAVSGLGPTTLTGGQWGSTARLAWLAFCACMAVLVIAAGWQGAQAESELHKRRLLEVSLQDLILQSTALLHLSHSAPAANRLGLETRGYDSPQGLLNQLSSRLAVIEAIDDQSIYSAHTQALRGQLTRLSDQSPQANNTTHADKIRQVDQWFQHLGALQAAVKNSAAQADSVLSKLQRQNHWLGSLVLLFCIGSMLWAWWQHSSTRKKLAARIADLQQEIKTDPLTGLLNRRGWEDAIHRYTRELGSGLASDGAVAILDIDYFKQYNDTYGHFAGDARLCEFTDMLCNNFRPGDLIARIGGEEFAVLLRNCSTEEATRIVDRIRASLAGDSLQFSAGVSRFCPDEGIERIMASADQALYQAKHAGRNRTCKAAA